MSRQFLQKKGESDIYVYGETPLSTLEIISQRCHLTAIDVVFELGCGRARTCFWLNSFIQCKVIGIDFVPEFIKKAEQVKEKFHLDNIDFRLEDFLKTDLRGGTVFYLYGICLPDEKIIKLIKRFEELPKGTKVVTVSYALQDYMTDKKMFKVIDSFDLPFLWGKGTIFIQEKSKEHTIKKLGSSNN